MQIFAHACTTRWNCRQRIAEPTDFFSIVTLNLNHDMKYSKLQTYEVMFVKSTNYFCEVAMEL